MVKSFNGQKRGLFFSFNGQKTALTAAPWNRPASEGVALGGPNGASGGQTVLVVKQFSGQTVFRGQTVLVVKETI